MRLWLVGSVFSWSESTLPTNHSRIRIAKVREYDYADASTTMTELESLSREVDTPTMVKMMKKVVPEFISKNSKFEEFDAK